MNKQELASIAKQPQSISNGDVNELRKLSEEYPYSQVLHTLLAKGSYMHAANHAQRDLHMAAMYATDRALLKSIIVGKTAQSVATKSDNQVKEKPSKSSVANNIPERKASDQSLSHSDSDQLRAQVLRDLDALVESKRHYEEEIKAFDNVLDSPKKSKSKKKATKAVKEKTVKEKESKEKKAKKAEKEVAKTTKTSSTKKTKKKEDKKEQHELIENFIKKAPSISKKVEKEEPVDNQKDLSAPSAQFNDDLISENLAQIMIKQGQKAKAIDIYKKLIWKFPQKKAYFATQIEALKK